MLNGQTDNKVGRTTGWFYNKKQVALRQKAFTLAEVLIVIGIIGIIANMTIPTLIENATEAQTRSGLKVAYSILSQAMTQISSENSGTIAGICEDFDDVCFKNMFKPALKYTKECNGQIATNGCWASVQYLDGSSYSWIDNAGADSPAGLILNNGMLVAFRWHYKNCAYPGNNKCGWIAVDINGFKKPNRWGKDTFNFHVADGVVKPFGSVGDTGNDITCNPTDVGSDAGYGCASKYLYD